MESHGVFSKNKFAQKIHTAQKMKKSLMENFIFCAVSERM